MFAMLFIKTDNSKMANVQEKLISKLHNLEIFVPLVKMYKTLYFSFGFRTWRGMIGKMGKRVNE